MEESYWSRILSNRIGRRRALTVTAGSAAAAAFLAACGSDSTTSTPTPRPTTSTGATGPTGATGATGGTGATGSTGPTSSLIALPVDTSKEAKKGGTFIEQYLRDPNHLDGQAQGQVQLNIFNGIAYGSLVQNKMGYLEPTTNTEVEPNMAESWEVSPDGTQYTFKLRAGVKWHNKPPVNGRDFVAEDVVASWQRYITLESNNRAANANQFNPAAPILSIEATDSRTVVMKLTEPASYIMQRLASMITGELGSGLGYPMETGDGFDPRQDQIGTGGFQLDRWQPSLELVYRRNPDYWDSSGPHFDEIRFISIPEYAAALAQFKTGNLHQFSAFPGITTDDVLPTKREVPDLNMYQWTAAGATPGAVVGFGIDDINGQKSPFLDLRVRRALSLALDRDAFIEAFQQVSRFESEGLPVDTYYYTAQGWVPEWHLDPRDSNFGPNAQWFEYNPTEAKSLLSAAGYGNDNFPEFPSHVVQAVFPPPYPQQAEVIEEMSREVGFKPVHTPTDYNIEYLPKIITQQGRFPGWVFRIGAVSSPDPVDFYIWRYWSKSGPTSGALGHDVNGVGDISGDPDVDRMIEKAKGSFDIEEQKSIIHDLQRHLGGMQYAVSRPGFSSQFILGWPAIENMQVFQGDSRAINQFLYTSWINTSKKPFA